MPNAFVISDSISFYSMSDIFLNSERGMGISTIPLLPVVLCSLRGSVHVVLASIISPKVFGCRIVVYYRIIGVEICT